MMKVKRLFALVLALLLVVAIMGGCGDSSPSTTTPTSTPSSTPSSSDESSPSDDRTLEGNVYTTGLPIVKERITLRVVSSKHTLDKTESFNEKAIFKKAAEETGIDIEWIEMVSGTESERVTIMLASDLPDIFYNGGLNQTHIVKNADSFVNLAEEGLLEKWAPNIVAQYATVDNMWDMLRFPDGNIYSLATSMATSYDDDANGVFFINQKWLDNVGMDMPTNTDELYDVLVAFRDKDPNGNGVQDEIPYEFCSNNWAAQIMNLAGPWGIAGSGSGNADAYYRIENGKISSNLDTQEFRDFLTYANKLADEGLLDVEGFSQTNQQFYAKLKEYVCGMYSGWTPSSNLDAETAKEYVVMPVLTVPGMEGKELKNGWLDRFRGNRTGFVITKECENVEAALRWFDYMHSSTEMKYLSRYGEEGILWEMDSSGGVWSIFPDNVTEDFTRENMKYTYGAMHTSPLILKSEAEQNDPDKYPASVERKHMVDALKDFFPTEHMPVRFVDADKQTELNFIQDELHNYVSGFIANAITSGTGLDDVGWDAHLAQLKSLNLEGWLQWHQDFIDGKF
jgi:putative aldouronate transport system substrate-binding protein